MIIQPKNEVPRLNDVTCSPHIHTQTHRVTTEGTLSGFHDFFHQPIIKDRPKKCQKIILVKKECQNDHSCVSVVKKKVLFVKSDFLGVKLILIVV